MKIQQRKDRGSALLVSLVITIAVIAISGAFISHSMIRQRSSMNVLWGTEAITAAEAGATLYLQDLNKAYWGPSATPPIVVSSPPTYRHGFLGSPTTTSTSNANKTTQWVDQTFYRVWYEPFGTNGIDDNGNALIDSADSAEANYARLWVEGYAGGVADVSVPTAPKYTGGSKRTVEVILTHTDGGVFWNAIFAGNSSNDTTYTMTFSGSGSTIDNIRGDIYSGGSIDVSGAAALLNETGSGPASSVMYNTTYTDTSSATNPTYVQGTQPNLDISSAGYATKAAAGAATRYNSSTNPTGSYVNVGEDLNTYGTTGAIGVSTSNTAAMGNAAKQILDTSNPAHMFRKEPTTSTSTTQKRVQGYSGMNPDKTNYFLEDPTKTADNGGTSASPWGASTGNTGLRVEVTPVTNNKVYYIDGNLWASNGPAFTFQWLNSTGADMKITIVVQGNVYLTDNLIYDQAAKALGQSDALAIIAINDPAHPSVSASDISNTTSPAYNFNGMASGTAQEKIDAARDYNKLHGSGNIFFGDPGGGTTERFESFLYAENNFYDNNLGGGAGTLETNILGNMTAGNQVQINRNASAGVWKPLKVQFDNRIKSGTVSLPGLPGNPASSGNSWKIASWRQVATRPTNWAGTGGGFTVTPQ